MSGGVDLRHRRDKMAAERGVGLGKAGQGIGNTALCFGNTVQGFGGTALRFGKTAQGCEGRMLVFASRKSLKTDF
jgi:hypothetical protein